MKLTVVILLVILMLGIQSQSEAIKRCTNPEDIDHGSVRVTDNIRYFHELYASYSCDIGHALKGQSTRNCNLFTGEWEGQAPTCEESSVDCGHPENVTNGTVDVSRGTKLHATAWYTCDVGFIFTATRYRTCGSDGRWSGTTPTCEEACSELEDIEHGSITHDHQAYRFYYVGYMCDEGYRLRGLYRTPFRRCDTFTGEWDSPSPKCILESNITCGHPGNIQYGTVNVSEGTKLHARVYYTCDRGYRLDGPTNRTCNFDGLWNGRDPTCEEINCGEPDNIVNGNVLVDNVTRAGSTVYYVCDEGYGLIGPSSRTCGIYGTWSGREPSCVVDCGHPGNITNGTVDVSDGTNIGEWINYSCDVEYILNGSSWRRCQSNGAWSGSEPTCEVRKRCSNPEDIEHGLVGVGNFYGLYAWYSCDRGYEMRGESRRYCDLFTGEWKGVAPVCEESNVDCGHPRNIQNGMVDVSEGTKLDARVYYTCDRGYRLNGLSSRICRFDGLWNGQDPTCKELQKDKNCEQPHNITNGDIIVVDQDTRVNSTIYYVCDEGYSLRGPSSRTCGHYGVWSGSEPSCVADCDHPGNIFNGRLVNFVGISGKNSIYYRCDEGYHLHGPLIRTCESDGKWSGIEPTCHVPRMCPDSEKIEHGSVQSILYDGHHFARYTCDIGYAMRGWWIRECNGLVGVWKRSTAVPSCIKSNVDCGLPGNISNGQENVSEGTTLGARIHYTCDKGYRLRGPSSRTCQSDSSWSGKKPTCEAPITCSNPEDITHGSVRVIHSKLDTPGAYYSCDVGYKLIGFHHRNCDTFTGKWIGTAPTCRRCDEGRCPTHGCEASKSEMCLLPLIYLFGGRHRCEGMLMVNYYGYWTNACQKNFSDGVKEVVCRQLGCGPLKNEYLSVDPPTKIFPPYPYDCDGKECAVCACKQKTPSYEETCTIRSDTFADDTVIIVCEENDSQPIVSCELPGDPEHGKAHVSGTTRGSQVNYTCDRGYRINGTSSRTCGPNGTWGGREPTCEPIDCGYPEGITNGRVDVSRGTKLGAKVRYSCNRGYKLKGQSTRKCQPNGRWNKRAPTCKKQN